MTIFFNSSFVVFLSKKKIKSPFDMKDVLCNWGDQILLSGKSGHKMNIFNHAYNFD